MFQIGLFTTHLPYILIIAIYAAAILFKPAHKEATFADDKFIRNHSNLVSYNKNSLYLKEGSHQFHNNNNNCCWKTTHNAPERQLSLPSVIPGNLKYSTSYVEDLVHTFLSKNIPNRAPPVGVSLHIIRHNTQM